MLVNYRTKLEMYEIYTKTYDEKSILTKPIVA